MQESKEPIAWGAVMISPTMQARMAQILEGLGCDIGIPGCTLEMDAEELAGLLARGRTGKLWGEEALP